MTSDRTARLAKNEALSRALNERIRDTTAALDFKGLIDPETDRGEYLCECADASCTKSVSLSETQYREVRSNAVWFFVVPGHEVTQIESVVASYPGYAIVEKHPGEAAIAAATGRSPEQ